MKNLGIKSQINLKTIKQNLFGSTFNNNYSLNISRNKKKIENLPMTKRENQLLYKSNSSAQTKFSFHNKNNLYKIHYYTIKINCSNSEEKNKNKKSYCPFINKKTNYLNKLRNVVNYKNKINNNLSVDKLVDLFSERKLKYLNPIEKNFKISKNLFNYCYKEKGDSFFLNERIFLKDLLKKKNFSHLSFSKLKKKNSYRENNIKLNNNGLFFQNEHIRKVLRTPLSKNKSMEIYSIFFHNKKH